MHTLPLLSSEFTQTEDQFSDTLLEAISKPSVRRSRSRRYERTHDRSSTNGRNARPSVSNCPTTHRCAPRSSAACIAARFGRLALAACAVLYDAERSVRCRADFNFRRRCRVKVVSQTNTLAVDHHHPLRPLTPLGFSTAQPPFSLERKTAVHERFAPLQFLAFI